MRAAPLTCTKTFCIFAALFFLSIHGFSQRVDWRSKIDVLVEKADSISFKSQIVFRAEQLRKNQEPIQETWYYSMDGDKVVIFQVRYVLAGTEFTEVYYVNNDDVICAEKVEAPNLSEYIDQVVRGELYFIENRMLRQYVTFGKKSSGYTHQDAQFECIKRFQDRYRTLKRNMEIVNATRRN